MKKNMLAGCEEKKEVYFGLDEDENGWEAQKIGHLRNILISPFQSVPICFQSGQLIDS